MESAHVKPIKPTQSSSVSAFTIFAFLWAAGILMHMASYSEPLRALQVLIVATAFIVIVRPSIVPAFLVLLVLHTAYVYRGLPRQPNHSILAVCADLTILTAALSVMLSKRSWTIDTTELYALFAPVLRIEFVVLYFFVVFHKLNTGFFNPEFSCTVVMYSRVVKEYPLLPMGDWAKVSVIYLTVIIEAAIPIMLLVRRLRVAGLLLAFAFHFLLAMDPGDVIYNFSAVLLALFFLFLPDDFPRALDRTLAPVRALWSRRGTNTLAWLLTRAVLYLGMPALMFALIFRGRSAAA